MNEKQNGSKEQSEFTKTLSTFRVQIGSEI